MTALATFSIQEFCARANDTELPAWLERRFREIVEAGEISTQERMSWANSLPALASLLSTLPIDGHILLEYAMPLGNRRADCVLIGVDAAGQTHIIVVELKQWSQGNILLNHEFDMGWLTVQAQEPYSVDHPCEQANVYRTALEHLLDFGDDAPQIHALAYLHRYRETSSELLRLPQFRDHLRSAYLLTLNNGLEEASQLLRKLQSKVPGPILERLQSPKLKYSDSFIANFSNKLNCSALFEPTKGQSNTFRSIASALDKISKPSCVIVRGIVGTGKTVLAMLLVRHLMERGKQPKYHVRSAAIRDCLKQLDFCSGGMAATEYLIVDEAHRFRADQLPRLLKGKRLAVFFIDDNQWLHPDETCRSRQIEQASRHLGMHVIEHTLTEQLRCRDAAAYISWVDAFLHHGDLSKLESADRFEVGLVESPEEMVQLLDARAQGATCRVVAGYCWEWPTAKTPSAAHDIAIDGWRARWNAPSSYAKWNKKPGLHEEVGAIYTVQGFEYDYVGVLIGTDLVFTEKGLAVRPSAQQYPQLRNSLNRPDVPKERKLKEFSLAIRNIYYVLLTRARKGVFIYAAHPGLQQALRGILPRAGAVVPLHAHQPNSASIAPISKADQTSTN